jgi:TnpA family transposase
LLKQHATSEEWALTASDHVLIATRSRARRLGFATLLLFFRANRRFPRSPAEIDTASVIGLADALGVDIETSSAILMPDRTMERHRSEIRALFGFREATVADAEALTAWARDHAIHQTRDVDHLIKVLETRCGTLSIEPPAPDRMERIVRTAVRAYEERLHGAAYDRLTPDIRKRLDALLRVSGTDEPRADGPELTPEEQATIGLNALRGDPGRASVNSLRDELGKLAVVREIALPADLFAGWSPQELEACRRRVAVESPFELRRHPEVTRLAWLAAFVHLRGRGIKDGLVDLLIETVHYIGAHAERRVEEELLDDLKRVGGKQNLLFALAGAAIDNPEDTVRNVIFPVVGEQTLQDLVREYKASGPTYQTVLRTTIRNSYRGHYRQAILRLIEALDFRSNNETHRPVIRALQLVRRFADTRLRIYPPEEDVPLDGIVRPLWRDAVIDRDPQGRQRVNRVTYEICVLEALREQLRCKEIWVVGANRYRNPDEDLPADFDTQRASYYEALNLTPDADQFVAGLKEEMRAALNTFDTGLPHNPFVRISKKAGGWITVTPLKPRPDPNNIEALKAEINDVWPMTNLLDIVKETDLRLRFTDRLKSATAYETLDREILRPRLLLCLNGLGTNAGLKRMHAAQHGATYKDLVYARHRYINVDQLRQAIAVVTNATLRIRDPAVWGEGTNACASDSKHFGAWDQNLTTQWHVRYGGRGIMIYWHVEKKSLCIHSQLKSPSSSEVASMIEGVIRHCTEMEIDRQYVDTHGQSVVAFAFARMLGFQLLPRLKAIHKQRLYRPDTGQPDAFPNLQLVLTRPIDWDLIRRQYDEIVKYTTALRMGTAEAEVILRRFTRNNVQHPTYKALAELGKVVKTTFLCRYLHDETLRREINDGLNVIEHWNGANDFVFFARRGELSSNRREDHELSMLSLHLLQNCMVYINTLMVQQILDRPHWKGRLTMRDLHALTPLFWGHINPYGRFELDMRTRIPLN